MSPDERREIRKMKARERSRLYHLKMKEEQPEEYSKKMSANAMKYYHANREKCIERATQRNREMRMMAKEFQKLKEL